MDYHLDDKWKCSGISDELDVCQNFDLRNNCFLDKAITDSIIPNLDSYDKENKQPNSIQDLSYEDKHYISLMNKKKADSFKPNRYINWNNFDNTNKHNQSQSILKIDLNQKTSPSFEEQLNEVFLKRSQNRICGNQRIDILNKGTLRFIRKVFRHLYAKVFEPKRKRTKQTKATQFENILNQFKNLWLDQNAMILKGGQVIQEFELIGRLINNQTYSLLPEKYTSTKSQEILNFVTLFDKCCKKYNHSHYNEIIKNKLFRFMVKVYEDF